MNRQTFVVCSTFGPLKYSVQRKSLYWTLIKICGFKTISWKAGNLGLHFFFNVCVSSGIFTAFCGSFNMLSYPIQLLNNFKIKLECMLDM